MQILFIIAMIFILRGLKFYFRPGPPKSRDRPCPYQTVAHFDIDENISEGKHIARYMLTYGTDPLCV